MLYKTIEPQYYNGESMNMNININSLSQKYSVQKLDENDVDMT